MLKTSKDFEEAVSYINNTLIEGINNGHLDQVNYLKSDAFNDTFYSFEKRINSLYEASRMMEDIIDYTKQYLSQNIKDAVDSCEDMLQEINNTKDSVKTREYRSYTVKLYEGTGSYIDRDNSELHHIDISNKKLVLPSQSTTVIPIKSVDKTISSIAYKSNINELIEGKPYRSYYILDNVEKGGMKEEITVMLNSPEEFNYVDILASNCSIDNVRFIDINGNKINDNGFNGYLSINKKLKEIIFTITCKDYTSSSIVVDKTRMSADFLTSINEYEYDSTVGITSAYDLEVSSGMKKYKEEYAKYQEDLKAWQKARDAWPKYISVAQEDKIIYEKVTKSSKIKVYGTGTDLKNAKSVFGYDNYEYIDTSTVKNYTLTSNDIILGGIGAEEGIGDINLNGATRLWGSDRHGTLSAIEEYAGKVIKVYGTGADLENARSILGTTNYEYIDTSKNKFDGGPGDIVLGGIGAQGGVGDINLNGAVRLFGTDREGTKQAIISYASR